MRSNNGSLPALDPANTHIARLSWAIARASLSAAAPGVPVARQRECDELRFGIRVASRADDDKPMSLVHVVHRQAHRKLPFDATRRYCGAPGGDVNACLASREPLLTAPDQRIPARCRP